MEFSFNFEMSEENKKVIEELLKQKGIKHYVLETKDKEKLDLVEYRDYKKIEEAKQELIDYLKDKIKHIDNLITKSKIKPYGEELNLYENSKLRYLEILSKIEKR